ncbi:MAG: hypothetical protein OXL35_09025 [Chloroflexota bacterium]|nr:hypothetical protein [Chloroflexota bacterium]
MDGNRDAEEGRVEWSGDAPSLESLRQLRLTALLADVMDELGQVKAAQKLGVDRKTLWRCRNTGNLTPRLSDALEHLLLTQDLSAAMRQGERVTELERQVTELQEELCSVREAGESRGDGLKEEHARAMRHVERRLVRLESGRTESGTPSATEREPEPTEGRYIPPRRHPQLVTEEAEPDEERVYGDATPVVVEWRKARDRWLALLETGPALVTAEAKMRMLNLEVAIIEEHELTLPPASYPWERGDRLDQARRRMRTLERAEADRSRALLRLWARRILTLGLWRN